MAKLTEKDGFYVIEKEGNTLHFVADIYWHDVYGWWTSEEPCGFYATIDELKEVGGDICDLPDWDGRKNYIYDDIGYEVAEENWNSEFHAHTLEELESAMDGTYIWEY